MNKFVKNVLSLSIFSAVAISPLHAATYSITDKGAAETHKNTLGVQENNLDEMVITGTDAYDFPVQFQYLVESDYDQIITLAGISHEQIFAVEDIENETLLRNGSPTENDLFWVIAYLQSKSSNVLYQQYGGIAALINLNNESQELVIFDEVLETSNLLTRSTVDIVKGITDRGWIYGSASAPYLPVELTDNNDTESTSNDDIINYWVRAFDSRGFYSPDRGETIVPLLPPEATYGGISGISDLSENGLAVGFASTAIATNAQSFIDATSESCSDEEQLETIPLIVCIDNILRSNGVSLSQLYSTQAFKWQISDNGSITSEALGHLITPHVDDTRELTSYALAVNDSGVVVGYADGWFSNEIASGEKSPERLSTKLPYAVVFKNGLIADFNSDHEKYFNSQATDINNNGIATGYAQTYIGGVLRNVFFHVDTNDIDSMEMTLPDSFFTGSSTTAKSINDQGFIVGQAEVETGTSTTRRQHGFMYNITTKKFSDLNTFLPCNSDYTILDANSINENNEITATALITQQRKDAFGVDIVDSNGDPVNEEVLRAIKLTPVDGEIETCTTDAEYEEEKVERQGASVSFILLFVLGVLGFRRRV